MVIARHLTFPYGHCSSQLKESLTILKFEANTRPSQGVGGSGSELKKIEIWLQDTENCCAQNQILSESAGKQKIGYFLMCPKGAQQRLNSSTVTLSPAWSPGQGASIGH